MADYNPILDAETDPEAGLRSSLFKRMVANPIAIAEGAQDAPRISYGAMAPGTTLLPYVGVSGSGWASIINLDDVGELGGLMAAGGAAGNFQIALSDNNGSSFAAEVTVGAIAGAAVNTGLLSLNLITGQAAWYRNAPVTVTLPAGPVNAIRFRSSGGGGCYYEPRIVAGKP